MSMKIENLHFSYGKREVLKGIDFSVEYGEFLSVLGPNGAGKSTLLNLLTDSIKRTSGEINFNGQDILKMGANFRERLGYMPQKQGMYEHYSLFLHLFSLYYR